MYCDRRITLLPVLLVCGMLIWGCLFANRARACANASISARFPITLLGDTVGNGFAQAADSVKAVDTASHHMVHNAADTLVTDTMRIINTADSDTSVGTSSPMVHNAADSAVPGAMTVARLADRDTSVAGHLPAVTSANSDTSIHLSSDTANIIFKDTLPPLIAPTLGPPDTTICQGTTLTLHAGTGFLHYSWNTGDTTESITAHAGMYQVTVSDSTRRATSAGMYIRERTLPELWGTVSAIDCRHVSGVITLQASGSTGAFNYAIDGINSDGRHNVFADLGPGTYNARVTDSTGCTSSPASFEVTGFPERTLKASAKVSAVHCAGNNDGAIRVNIELGRPPFEYILDELPAKTNNVFSHVFPGPHRVIVNSDFCSDTLQLVVADMPPIQFAPAVVEETAANNGSIILHPRGGNAPYVVTWDHTALKTATLQHLPAATYTAHITDNYGCVSDSSITVPGKLKHYYAPESAIDAMNRVARDSTRPAKKTVKQRIKSVSKKVVDALKDQSKDSIP